MFKHEKMLFHPISVEKPNAAYAALLQEQLGGANGEMTAAMQYMLQSFRVKDPVIKDLLLDIAAEELGHMEMIAQTINLLSGQSSDAASNPPEALHTRTLIGLNPGLVNASGYTFTGDYISVTGDLYADLLSNIATEARASAVYESLHRQIGDRKVRATIEYLLSREDVHTARFREAFNRMQDTPPDQAYSNTPKTSTAITKMYFNAEDPAQEAGHLTEMEVRAPAF